MAHQSWKELLLTSAGINSLGKGSVSDSCIDLWTKKRRGWKGAVTSTVYPSLTKGLWAHCTWTSSTSWDHACFLPSHPTSHLCSSCLILVSPATERASHGRTLSTANPEGKQRIRSTVLWVAYFHMPHTLKMTKNKCGFFQIHSRSEGTLVRRPYWGDQEKESHLTAKQHMLKAYQIRSMWLGAVLTTQFKKCRDYQGSTQVDNKKDQSRRTLVSVGTLQTHVDLTSYRKN